jgi:hypothetical protein
MNKFWKIVLVILAVLLFGKFVLKAIWAVSALAGLVVALLVFGALIWWLVASVRRRL